MAEQRVEEQPSGSHRCPDCGEWLYSFECECGNCGWPNHRVVLRSSPFDEPTYEDVERGIGFVDRWWERREKLQ